MSNADAYVADKVKVQNSSGTTIDPATEQTVAAINNKLTLDGDAGLKVHVQNSPATSSTVQGTVDDVSPVTTPEGSAGAVRMTPTGDLHANLRKQDGSETGVVGAPLRVDPTGSTTQPVSGTFWQATQPVSATTLPLPTGAGTEATLAAILAKFPASGPDAGNSSQANLGAAGAFNGTFHPASELGSILAFVLADEPFATPYASNICIQWSSDGATANGSTTAIPIQTTVVGPATYYYGLVVVNSLLFQGTHYRIHEVNGTTPQTTNYVISLSGKHPTSGSILTLTDTLNQLSFAQLVRSVIAGVNSAGAFQNVSTINRTDGSVALQVDSQVVEPTITSTMNSFDQDLDAGESVVGDWESTVGFVGATIMFLTDPTTSDQGTMVVDFRNTDPGAVRKFGGSFSQTPVGQYVAFGNEANEYRVHYTNGNTPVHLYLEAALRRVALQPTVVPADADVLKGSSATLTKSLLALQDNFNIRNIQIGQQSMDASVPVALAVDQSPINTAVAPREKIGDLSFVVGIGALASHVTPWVQTLQYKYLDIDAELGDASAALTFLEFTDASDPNTTPPGSGDIVRKVPPPGTTLAGKTLSGLATSVLSFGVHPRMTWGRITATDLTGGQTIKVAVYGLQVPPDAPQLPIAANLTQDYLLPAVQVIEKARDPSGNFQATRFGGLAANQGTMTTIAAGGTFTAPNRMPTTGFNGAVIIIRADHNSAVNGVRLRLFTAQTGGVELDPILKTYNASPSTRFLKLPLVPGLYFQTEVQAGASDMTNIFVQTALIADEVEDVSIPLVDLPNDEDIADLTMSRAIFRQDNGNWAAQVATNSGNPRMAIGEAIRLRIQSLNTWDTNQAAVTSTPVQVNTSPSSYRGTVSFKAHPSNSGIIYIGNSSAVTTGNGYPLGSGESVEMDLNGSDSAVWAVASADTQALAWMNVYET